MAILVIIFRFLKMVVLVEILKSSILYQFDWWPWKRKRTDYVVNTFTIIWIYQFYDWLIIYLISLINLQNWLVIWILCIYDKKKLCYLKPFNTLNLLRYYHAKLHQGRNSPQPSPSPRHVPILSIYLSRPESGRLSITTIIKI